MFELELEGRNQKQKIRNYQLEIQDMGQGQKDNQ